MIVAYDVLKDQVTRVFAAAGFTDENAAQMADVMVTAEARGVYSHGIQLVSGYLSNARDGMLKRNPELKVLKESDSALLVDGDWGLGGISLTRAMDLAMEKAKKTGSCTLCMVNTNHYGAGAYYVEKAAKAGMISYLYANAPKNAAPFGGAERYFGTNPYSFAAPAGKYGNMVLDMATTETAAGKLLAAINDKVPVRLGFGLDKDGNPTTDPNAILNEGGSMCHFGGVKGYGIAFMINVVTGVLTGAAYKADDVGMLGWGKTEPTISFYMHLTDISRFIDPKEYETRAEDLIDDIKKVKPAPGFDTVCFPGEIENKRLAQAKAEGVHIHDAAYASFQAAAAYYNVTL